MDEEATSSPSRRLKAPYAFLDACAYRSLGFDWDGRWLAGIADLARRGLLKVVITDVTKREVDGLMREAIAKAKASVAQSAVVLRQTGMQEMVAKLDAEEACLKAMRAARDKWLRQCHAVTLKPEADITVLLDDYFNQKPPFGPGGARKAEFPDAIIVATLRAWTTKNKRSMYVVSGDKGILECCSLSGPLFSTSSVREILSHAAASVAIHEAIWKELTETDWLADNLDGDLTGAFEIRNGQRRGATVSVAVESAEAHDQEIQELLIDEMQENEVTCTVYLWVKVKARVFVTQDPVQIGPDDWDRGWRDYQYIYPTFTTTVTLAATVTNDNSVDLRSAFFDDAMIVLDFEDIVRDLD
jgi:hypothetical protein